MAEEKTNLEPIEEGEKSLAEKFGHVEKNNFDKNKNYQEAPVNFQEKEIKEEIVSAEKDGAYGKILSKIQKRSDDEANDKDVQVDAKKISLKNDAESQLQHLVDLATSKDIPHAVKVARHLEDNYVLDAFHDKLLSEELHSALVEKGLIN